MASGGLISSLLFFFNSFSTQFRRVRVDVQQWFSDPAIGSSNGSMMVNGDGLTAVGGFLTVI